MTTITTFNAIDAYVASLQDFNKIYLADNFRHVSRLNSLQFLENFASRLRILFFYLHRSNRASDYTVHCD